MQIQQRQLLRRFMRHQRAKLPKKQQQRHAQQLRQHFCQNRLLQTAKHIGVYLAQAGEINLTPLIKKLWQRQKHCYLPRLHRMPTRQMDFIAYQQNSRLIPNRFNILEPCNQTQTLAIAKLDVVLIPLVAFDSRGNRLGMGGGYYDYTFRRYKQRFNRQAPKLIGVAHSFQQVTHLTAYRWDIPLDAIITEQKIIQRMAHAH